MRETYRVTARKEHKKLDKPASPARVGREEKVTEQISHKVGNYDKVLGGGEDSSHPSADSRTPVRVGVHSLRWGV